jgi:hypothetical protein
MERDPRGGLGLEESVVAVVAQLPPPPPILKSSSLIYNGLSFLVNGLTTWICGT